MKSKNNFLFNLIENIIGVFNKLFNLFFITAILFILSERLDNKILYWVSVIVFSLLILYVVWLSYKLYIKKGDKISGSNILGLVLCIFFAYGFLYLTFSATVFINMVIVKP